MRPAPGKLQANLVRARLLECHYMIQRFNRDAAMIGILLAAMLAVSSVSCHRTVLLDDCALSRPVTSRS